MQPQPLYRLSQQFARKEVEAAFAALSDAQGPFVAPSLAAFSSNRSARTRSSTKQHLDIPLSALHADSAARAAVPVAVLRIHEGLESAARLHAEAALAHPAVPADARRDVLDGLGKRSVLRLLRYEPGVGCRPHVDPGLCTALLLGSSGGLELNLQEGASLPLEGRPGNYRYDAADGSGDAEGCNRLDQLSGWFRPTPAAGCSADTLVMTSNMLQVLSRGQQRGVLHRVRYDWAADGGDSSRLGPRCNIIVELRPASPKRWYRLMAEIQAQSQAAA